jgi:hypothetical protein
LAFLSDVFDTSSLQLADARLNGFWKRLLTGTSGGRSAICSKQNQQQVSMQRLDQMPRTGAASIG